METRAKQTKLTVSDSRGSDHDSIVFSAEIHPLLSDVCITLLYKNYGYDDIIHARCEQLLPR